MEVEFEYEKDTKNAVRFKEVADPPVIGTLYVQKWALKNAGLSDTKKLTVKVEAT